MNMTAAPAAVIQHFGSIRKQGRWKLQCYNPTPVRQFCARFLKMGKKVMKICSPLLGTPKHLYWARVLFASWNKMDLSGQGF